MLLKLALAGELLAATLFSVTVSASKHTNTARPLSLTAPACTHTHSTYALITPSPNAEPYPITSIGQAVTSLNPQYAICHHDSLECTTIYSTKTWSYCSATVPCYNQPASHGWCTVTDCADIVTFSKDNSYFLQTSPTLSILPVVTNYALPYSDYAAQRHTAVHVEHCIEAECKTHKESWERNIYTNYEQSALPVTMHNYYPTPTVVTYSGITHSVTKPTTITYVTRSMKTVTHEAVKMTTVTIRHKSAESVPMHPSFVMPTRKQHIENPQHVKTAATIDQHYTDKHTQIHKYQIQSHYSAAASSVNIPEHSIHNSEQAHKVYNEKVPITSIHKPAHTPHHESVHKPTKAREIHATMDMPKYKYIASPKKYTPVYSIPEHKTYQSQRITMPVQKYTAPPNYHHQVANTTHMKNITGYSTATNMDYNYKPSYAPESKPKPYHTAKNIPSYHKKATTSKYILSQPTYNSQPIPKHDYESPKMTPSNKTTHYTSSQYHADYDTAVASPTIKYHSYSSPTVYSAPRQQYTTRPSAVYSSYCSSSLSSSSYEVKSSYSSYVPSYNASSKYIKPYSTPSYIVPSPYNTPSYTTTSHGYSSYSSVYASSSSPSHTPYSSPYTTSSYATSSYAKPTIPVYAPPPPPAVYGKYHAQPQDSHKGQKMQSKGEFEVSRTHTSRLNMSRPTRQPNNAHENSEHLDPKRLPPANNAFVEGIRQERNRAATSSGRSFST